MLAGLLPDNFVDPMVSFFDAWQAALAPFFSRLAMDLPPEAWWLPLIVLLVLGATASVDAFKGRVPDPPVFLGLFFAVATLGFYGNWPLAAERLATGLGAALALYVVNQLYYNWRQHDAIGMGYAKWTALAIAAFGILPAVYAWVIGACLGLAWLITARSLGFIRRLLTKSPDRREIDRVHFAPFLFAGLLAGLYWNYLR